MIANKTRVFAILIIIFGSFLSCQRRDEHPVPYVPVNITLHVSDPEFFNLNAVGGSTQLTGGSRGILVYRKTEDEFMAYDRHCTYDSNNPLSVVMLDPGNSFSAIDTSCTSQFFLIDGSVQKGPAQFPLRQYQTTFDGVKLNIFN
ncbi:MAG: hypothetical protein M3Q58_01010 [Bacteroidota bacterium]|nr:hypothetical protein [Bacteroidota bacterium]